ncbi:hypothetical protein CPB84DRAFT_1793662 [Gymnopilus junonius]|uniref:HNH nuclease domain-containing protein n=1 Tax=Gymnopilus junonius TaxID=109634 RepID=A0A9P5TGS1_GYMJU|nr:hypothetical protein CPB84DRAFT_1793662 [Gymnopilus junonius]
MAAAHPQRQLLLPNTYNSTTEGPLHYAYEQCLEMETTASTDQETLSLAHSLSRAKVIVANEVPACNADNDDMKDLSQFYINHLIRHPSQPSFEMHRAFFSKVAEPAPRDHSTAKSSRYNIHPNSLETNTNYCHIFPPLTNWSFDPNDLEEKKKRYVRMVWAIINTFGAIDILSELEGEKIHCLENGFTMDQDLHTYFDDLKLWFEQVPNVINTYRVCMFSNTISPLLVFPPNHIITFTSTDPHLPVPNPAYLNLHAAICYLDLEDCEIEKLKVLSHNGSSAKFLASRLKSVELRT